jgi:magnesium transporter
VTINAIVSHADGTDETIELRKGLTRELSDDTLLWIDLAEPDEREIDAVREALSVDGEMAELLSRELGRPVATVHEAGLEVVVAGVDPEEIEPQRVQILVGNDWIVTRHDVESEFLDEGRRAILDARELGRLRPVEFLASVLGWQLDTFFATADSLEREIDDLDDAALRGEEELLERLVRLRRRIAKVRRILNPHRDLFAELTRPDFMAERFAKNTDVLSALPNRLERAADAIANAREMLIGSFDIHMTRLAQRTNDVMRVLTLVSVVLLPSVVIAGVMGMNFRVAFFEEPMLFWVVVAAMAALAAGTVLFARSRRWL